MIDFSHANSHKDYRRQAEVAVDVAGQIAAGSRAIFGVMKNDQWLADLRQRHFTPAEQKEIEDTPEFRELVEAGKRM